MQIDLQPGEVSLGSWALFYLPPGGGKYNGTLAVTNRRLLYDAMFDASLLGVLASTLIIRSGNAGYLEIDKTHIRNIDVRKRLLSKQCILTLTDGSQHTFDYGILNIDKTVSAIRSV